MTRSSSSRAWLKEHLSDPFVQKANRQGYRSRAVYKLIELQEKYSFIKPISVVVDLGAAPGSWSQYVTKIVHHPGKIIALDILPMEPIEGVDFIQGDFNEKQTVDILTAKLGKNLADCVISDMAPNTMGIKSVDQLRSMTLTESVFDFANQVLTENGTMLVKVFQGAGFDELIKNVKKVFKKVYTKKPNASKNKSYEVYILAIGFNGCNVPAFLKK